MGRIKNIEAFCSTCSSIQKMELGGEVASEESSEKRWAKCKKCKQTTVIDLAENINVAKLPLEGIETQDNTVYTPAKTYTVGELIYHKDWDDFGRVISKEILSTGQKSIAVEFQKSGFKKLIESLNN